ncbi:MAG TPA: FkbM family methyltransferase [Mucilaginibacter sp.]|jgi:FkbM family methyltransferase
MEKIKRTIGFIFTHPIGKKHPIKSLYRFILWQLQCNLSPDKFIVKDYIHGIKFYARKGLTGITGNIYSGLHEFNDMGFLLHFLRPNDTFFDIGANVGSFTLLASGVCRAKSIAIEPVPSTFNVLSKNIELNSLHEKVYLINSGAGGKQGKLTFSSNQDTTNHVTTEDEKKKLDTIEVSMITIDSLLIDSQPNLIKIDVEGFETEVLNGMGDTLSGPSLKAIIIELNGSGERYGFNENNIHELLLANDFKPYTYDPFSRLLLVEEKFNDFNTIYCRDVNFVNNRIKSALEIKVMGEII